VGEGRGGEIQGGAPAVEDLAAAQTRNNEDTTATATATERGGQDQAGGRDDEI